LIAQAKAEWAKKHPVKQVGPGDGGLPIRLPVARKDISRWPQELTKFIVVSDPDSPDFDLEKFLNHVAGEKA
jgi:hypothetical protein